MSEGAAFFLFLAVLAVCLTTCSILEPSDRVQVECIKAHGTWDQWGDGCKFK